MYNVPCYCAFNTNPVQFQCSLLPQTELSKYNFIIDILFCLIALGFKVETIHHNLRLKTQTYILLPLKWDTGTTDRLHHKTVILSYLVCGK